ncbi:hypothetical protein HA402_014035 [Bradysia odoriphaga]|nr:hypothetical protein HA402_014035 [Bradysia odoriphaga]
MDELKDASIHHTAIKISNEIKNMKLYGQLYKTVQKLVCSPDVNKDNIKSTLQVAILANGLDTDIRNIVYHLIRSTLKNEFKSTGLSSDHLNYLRRAGIQWERRVRKSLCNMCNEMQVTLQGQPRISVDKEELLNKWNELSNYQIDLSSYRPVYAPKDLLEVLLSLKGPQRQEDDLHPKWEFSHIGLPVKKIYDLRMHFLDLIRNEKTTNWSLQCQKVLQKRHAPLCQHLLKRGQTPTQYRGAFWSYVLGSHVEQYDQDHWDKLKLSVLNTDLIVDKLIFKDVQLTATNDDQYFVFEDVLYQVMLCFSRDTEINQIINQDVVNNSKTKQYDGPPSVVPFHGICMFAAPFCYLFDSPVKLYFTFRAFYIRYCHRLTTINTHPQGIVSLCLLFEKLLQTHEPELWSHFREIQIQPIRIVFKWLMRAFSGHLPPDELLILWDLILGFDSLEIIPLLAIVILSFRKESLMQVETLENIEAVLADLSSIKVLPLLQLALTTNRD